MGIEKLTTVWKKVLERQPRPVTILISVPWTGTRFLYVRLGRGTPGYGDADIAWKSLPIGSMITLPIPPNTAVYARTSTGTRYISCTIIPSIEEE